MPVWDDMLTTSSQFMKCGAENGGSGPQDVAAAAHKLQDTLDHSTDAANSNQETSERRARVKDLFYAMDKDGNGKLDVGEFRGWSYHRLMYLSMLLHRVFGIQSSCLRSKETFGQA